jgi:hypothetical protein
VIVSTFSEYALGEPRPKMHDTLATTTVSRRLSRLLVLARRSWSRSSFRLASFSM